MTSMSAAAGTNGHQQESITLNDLLDLASHSLEIGSVNTYILKLALRELKIFGNGFGFGREILPRLDAQEMSNIHNFKNYIYAAAGTGKRATPPTAGGIRINQQFQQPTTTLIPGQTPRPRSTRNSQGPYQFGPAQPMQALPPIPECQPHQIGQPLFNIQQRPGQLQQSRIQQNGYCGYPQQWLIQQMTAADQTQQYSFQLGGHQPQFQVCQPEQVQSAEPQQHRRQPEFFQPTACAAQLHQRQPELLQTDVPQPQLQLCPPGQVQSTAPPLHRCQPEFFQPASPPPQLQQCQLGLVQSAALQAHRCQPELFQPTVPQLCQPKPFKPFAPKTKPRRLCPLPCGAVKFPPQVRRHREKRRPFGGFCYKEPAPEACIVYQPVPQPSIQPMQPEPWLPLQVQPQPQPLVQPIQPRQPEPSIEPVQPQPSVQSIEPEPRPSIQPQPSVELKPEPTVESIQPQPSVELKPEPTVESIPPEPSVESIPPEPSVESVPPEPSVELKPEPSVESIPPEPSVELKPEPSVESIPPEPSVELPPQPSVESIPPEPLVELPLQPSVESIPPEPSVELPLQPSVESIPPEREPSVESLPSEPSVESIQPHQPSVVTLPPDREPSVQSLRPPEPSVHSLPPEEPSVQSIPPEPSVHSLPPEEPSVQSIPPEEPSVQTIPPPEQSVQSLPPQPSIQFIQPEPEDEPPVIYAQPEQPYYIAPPNECIEQGPFFTDPNCCFPFNTNPYMQTGVRPCDSNLEAKITRLERQFEALCALPPSCTIPVPKAPEFKYCIPAPSLQSLAPPLPVIIPPSCRKPPAPKLKSRKPKRSCPPPKGAVECCQCGRYFAPDRIDKHEEICMRSAANQRTVFNPTTSCLTGREPNPCLATGCAKKPAPACNPAPSCTSAGRKKCDWRKKHEDFIRTIRTAKECQYYAISGNPNIPLCDVSNYSKCPHCCRKISASAILATHIHLPNCQSFKAHRRRC